MFREMIETIKALTADYLYYFKRNSALSYGFIQQHYVKNVTQKAVLRQLQQSIMIQLYE